MAQLAKNWKAKNIDVVNGIQRTWVGRNPAQYLWNGARARTRKSGVTFTITPEDVQKAWPVDGRCPVLGVRLIWGTNGKGTMPESASLDRIDSKRGYEPNNIAVISHRANAIKHDATAEELRRIADWLDSKTMNVDNELWRAEDSGRELAHTF